MATRNRTYFLVETLDYLQKGGRIGAAKALLGSLLQVKPLLSLADGEVGVVESQRTSKKAMRCFIERIERECPRSRQAYLNIMHGGVIEQARILAAELGQRLGVTEIPILDLPSAILVHGGPGVLGVSFYVA
jgi:DegV family protein with EDD domain